MRYKFEIVGMDSFLTDDPDEIMESMESHIEADDDKQILICIGDHEAQGY